MNKIIQPQLLSSASGDSEDTVATYSSSEDIESILLEDVSLAKLKQQDEFIKGRPRPQSLTVAKSQLNGIISVRRQNSDPITVMEKRKCIVRIESSDMRNPGSLNLISLVKFIRTRASFSRSIRLPTIFDDESSDRDSTRHAHSSSRSSLKVFCCGICLENNSFGDACSYSTCTRNHKYCRQCLSSYVNLQIKDGVILHVCPFENCNQVANDSDIQSLVGDEMFNKYLRFREMKLNPSYRECSACGQQISLPDGFLNSQDHQALKPMLTCACGQTTCYYHGDAHPQESCGEYSRRVSKEECASRRLVSSIARRCPSCRAPTEKLGGCNHMTCQFCVTNWCWLCGQTLSDDQLNNHYDPTNLLSGCSGGQFRAAPALAWWSVCERLETACSGVMCFGMCGNCDSAVDVEVGRSRSRHHLRCLQHGSRMVFAIVHTSAICVLFGSVGAVFCASTSVAGLLFAPFYVLASCGQLAVVSFKEETPLDRFVEINRRLRRLLFDFAMLLGLGFAFFVLTALQLLWLPLAVIYLLAQTCVHIVCGVDYKELFAKTPLLELLCWPSVKVLMFLQQTFGEDD